MVKIFVGGFPLDMQEIELVQLIATYGEVCTIKIVRDKKTGKCKGYAFLEMSSAEAAENAIRALNSTPIGLRELSLKLVEETITTNPQFPMPIATSPCPVFKKVEIRSGTAKKKRPRKIV